MLWCHTRASVNAGVTYIITKGVFLGHLFKPVLVSAVCLLYGEDEIDNLARD